MKQSQAIYIGKLVLLFMVVSFILDKCCFFCLNQLSDRVYTGQTIGKLNHYLKIKDEQDIVIFGSSRATQHVNPDDFEGNAFNIGQDGREIAYAATIIKLLPKNKRQTVLVHIDPHEVFSEDYDGSDIDGLQTKYIRNKEVTKSIDNLGRNKPFQKFYWSINYNNKVLGIVKNFLRPKHNYKTYNGYDPVYLTKKKKAFYDKFIDYQPPCLEEIQLNPIYESQLKEIVSFCEANNKELMFFTTPIYNDDCKDDNRALVRLMAEKGLDYIDYTDYFREDGKREFWKDRNHLTHVGSAIFSKKFSDDIGLAR